MHPAASEFIVLSEIDAKAVDIGYLLSLEGISDFVHDLIIRFSAREFYLATRAVGGKAVMMIQPEKTLSDFMEIYPDSASALEGKITT